MLFFCRLPASSIGFLLIFDGFERGPSVSEHFPTGSTWFFLFVCFVFCRPKRLPRGPRGGRQGVPGFVAVGRHGSRRRRRTGRRGWLDVRRAAGARDALARRSRRVGRAVAPAPQRGQDGQLRHHQVKVAGHHLRTTNRVCQSNAFRRNGGRRRFIRRLTWFSRRWLSSCMTFTLDSRWANLARKALFSSRNNLLSSMTSCSVSFNAWRCNKKKHVS